MVKGKFASLQKHHKLCSGKAFSQYRFCAFVKERELPFKVFPSAAFLQLIFPISPPHPLSFNMPLLKLSSSRALSLSLLHCSNHKSFCRLQGKILKPSFPPPSLAEKLSADNWWTGITLPLNWKLISHSFSVVIFVWFNSRFPCHLKIKRLDKIIIQVLAIMALQNIILKFNAHINFSCLLLSLWFPVKRGLIYGMKTSRGGYLTALL